MDTQTDRQWVTANTVLAWCHACKKRLGPQQWVRQTNKQRSHTVTQNY